MLINVNTDTLLKSKLTAHQFAIAWFISQEKYQELETYLKETFSIDRVHEDLNWLWKQGFLMELSFGPAMIPKDYMTTPKFTELVSANGGGDLFDEFYREYPIKVVRPNGDVDYLRADRESSRRIYAHLTKGDKQIHVHIIKCLRHEVKKRYANGSLNYMKRLNKWLSTREWESYEDEVDDLSSAATRNEGETRYGTEFG